MTLRSIQPTDRTSQERERKKKTGKERNKQKICYACKLDNHEIRDCDSGKNIFILTEKTGK